MNNWKAAMSHYLNARGQFARIPRGWLMIGVVCALSVHYLMPSSVVQAQEPTRISTTRDLDKPRFSIDFAQFQSDSAGLTRVEVYYRVPNSGVTFRPSDSGFEARFEMGVAIYQGKRQLASKSEQKKLTVADYARTKLGADFIISQIAFHIPPGKCKIVARLSDIYSAGEKVLTADLKVRDLAIKKMPRLSDIEFLYSSARGQGGARFQKGDMSVVPVVERSVMGGIDGGPLLLYFELYSGADTNLNALIDLRIRSQPGEVVYRDTIYQKMSEGVVRQLRSINIESLQPGRHSVSVEIFGSGKKPLARSSGDFTVRWSLMATVRDRFNSVVDQLDLIAERQELKELREAVSPEERIAAWRNFWDARDPNPDTPENEAREEFYRRIDHANELFGKLRKDGWSTDRGRTLIKFGQPDEVAYEVMPLSSGAYEFWFYYNYKGEFRRFEFRDTIGDGEYHLQYPFDGRY